ncbi:MAG TPA: hypothetical protein VK468_04445 [Pyrinomonadaceae bacterium]|nr:hypothetical protein [Pyrinomonadaceae bacterium]
MSKRLLTLSIGAVLAISAASAAFGQQTVTTTTKKTEVIQNPDGSYSVIEYPVGKEVVVNLLPGTTVVGSKGTAHIIRSADGTRVAVDLSGVTGDTSSIYAYAVDPSGATTLLGPVTLTDGSGRAEFTTPMNQFMVVLSPTEGLTTYDDSASNIYYRSELPKGYAIVPRRRTDTLKAVATAESVGSSYDVPLLGVPKWQGKTTEVRVKFNGELQGLDGKAYLKPEGGKTSIKMRFGDMKKVPSNKRFVLWASSPDGKYTKLGQVINAGGRDESEIRTETALSDFGLFLTMEEVDVSTPTSRTYSVFSVAPTP